jgi:competence protein ComEC
MLSLIISLIFRKIAILIIVFSIGFYISQTGGILKTEFLVEKQFLTTAVDKIFFRANVGFIEENHPTMQGMQRIILDNIIFDDDLDHKKYSFIKTVKMTCGSKMLFDISPKDTVKVMASFSPFKIPAIPGSFDQLQFNSIMGIDATGVIFYIKKSQYEVIRSRFMENFSYIRFYMTKTISEKIHGEASGIAAALLTGDKSAIPPHVRDKFIKSGTAHILAISGLHMSILAGILYFLIRRLFLYIGCIAPNINASVVSAVFTIPFLFLYLALSGFSPSAIRAFIMSAICLFSIIMGKRAISLKNISVAAFLILLFDPGSLFHVSFQLSFAAVLTLISFYESYQEKLSNLYIGKSVLKKTLMYVVSSVITTTIATIATTPISVSTFNRFSVQNIFGNLTAIPITTFLIAPLGVLNICIGSFTDMFMKPLEMAINLMIKIMSFVSDLPGSEIPLRSPTVLIMSTIILGGIILCLLRTKLRHVGTALIFVSLFLYVFVQKNPYIIMVPEEDNLVCVIEGDKLYANSKRKGRNKIDSIMRNLGIMGEINKLSEDFKIPPYKYDKKYGLFIWKNGDIKQIAKRRHQFCPAYYTTISGELEGN